MKQTTQSSKRMVVLFLFLMIVGMITSFLLYNSLQKTRSELRASNKNLLAANEALSHAKDSIRVLNERFIANSKNLVAAVNSKIPTEVKNKPQFEDVSRAMDSTWNLLDKKRFEKAIALEKQGFEAVEDGNFEEAIRFFEETEKVYKSFHQANEIATYLKQNRSRFENPKAQKEIQRKIVSDYSMKAPQSVLVKLKEKTGS